MWYNHIAEKRIACEGLRQRQTADLQAETNIVEVYDYGHEKTGR